MQAPRFTRSAPLVCRSQRPLPRRRSVPLPRLGLPSLALVILPSLLGLPARADYPTRLGTRALGMGGALRASATGDTGPMLNPAGISLIRAYVVEGGYQLDDMEAPSGTMAEGASAHRAHVSVVDSTAGSRLGGAAYYTYLTSRPAPGLEVSGHQFGSSLSFPFGDHLALGTTVKYLSLTEVAQGPASAEGRRRSSGFTLDLGTVLRPWDGVGLALVGYNLIDRDSAFAPRAVGYGVAFGPIPALLLTFDGVSDFDSRRFRTGIDGTAHSLMGGAEYVLPAQVALRAGGGQDGVRNRGFVSAGVSGVSEAGAIDLAVMRDLSGDAKQTIFAASVRLFVPNP